MKILAIETSCDETAAAVVKDGRYVLSSVVATQIEAHKLYGGVVPEIASRMHTENICEVTRKALDDAGFSYKDIDAVAVTYAPGLIGALLTGIGFAKGLSYSLNIPLIPVHHLRGHIAASYLEYKDLEPPFLALVASGGHSNIIEVKDYTSFHVLGKTRDDAAGEAFDKVARVLGLTYPGGAKIDNLSEKGNGDAIKFPRVIFEDNPYDFSFSGVKTAVLNYINNSKQKEKGTENGDINSLGETASVLKEDIAASFNKCVCETLADKLILAANDFGYKKIILSGGVTANRYLRQYASVLCEKQGMDIYLLPLNLCADNAAMIGAQAFYEFKSGVTASLDLNGYATMDIEKVLF